MSEAPLISVIVPTCDRLDSLRACLRTLSPNEQSIAPERYEVIVTDDSRSPVAAAIAEEFPWAQYAPGPRRGPAANRNSGASKARGRYLAFIDDDCLATANWLTAFEANLNLGRVLEGKTITDGPLRGPFSHAPVNESGGYLWSCNFLIERQLFDQLGGFDENFPFAMLEDVDLRTRLVKLREPFVFVQDALVEHPQRPTVGALKYARQCESYYYFSQKHGGSVAAAGLSFADYARVWFRMLKRSRNPIEFIGALVYINTLALALLWLKPGWSRKYGVH